MRIGVFYDNIDNSDSCIFLFNTLNHLTDQGIECCLFTNYVKYGPVNNKFSILHQSAGYAFTGTLIASDPTTAKKVLHCFGTNDKYYYLWSLDYVRGQQMSFETIQEIYKNPKLKLITRSIYHKDIIEKNMRTNVVYVFDNWKLGEKML